MASMAMTEKEFRSTLQTSLTCKCGAVHDSLEWHVAPYGKAWMAVCVVGCHSCSWNHIAAAGNTDAAHEEAQRLRSLLLRTFGK